MQSVSNLAEGHLQALCFFAVDADQILRVVCREAGEKPHDILAGIPLRSQLVRRVRDTLQRVSSKILQLKLKSAELPEPKHRRWIERNDDRAGYCRERTAQTLTRCRGRVASSLAILNRPQLWIQPYSIGCRT